jgi:tetratricopeptide (TPR) repeat protein
MSGIPWESEEKQNYIRVRHIVMNVARTELRKFFIQEWNNRYQASFGAWDDTNVSGNQLFNREKTRARPYKNMFQSKFQHGDTNQWDSSVLFDAILYSNSIGACLSPKIKTEVDNLRKSRNKITHEMLDEKLTDIEFQTMTTSVENALNTLGLSIREVVRIRNLYKSFQVLPPKPAHEVVCRSEKIHEIKQDLQNLHCDNDGKLTYYYISGNPGSGKSQLAGQVCEDIYNGANWQNEATFVMTLDGQDLNSLLYSYEDFCRRLNCNESVLQSILNSSKPTDEKIKDLRSQITTRIKNWKKWWILVDNVENLELISPLLPQRGDKVWNNGQVILTTQNTNCVPPDSSLTKHISLSLGMNDQECRQLLSKLSKPDDNDVNDPLLDEVAEKLDRQPLAMAAAAVYMREVIESKYLPDFSWRDYLGKLEKGERKLTAKRLREINSAAYSSTMSTAVHLAVEKCAESNTILKNTFHLFSLISFEPLPLDLVVKYIQQQHKELKAEDISPVIKHCSLFVHVGNDEHDIRLHRVVHEEFREFCLSKEPHINDFFQTGIPNIASVIHNVVQTMYHFEGRKDETKLIPHLKAFHTEMNKLFADHALYSISLDFEKNEISQIYLYFGHTSRRFFEFKLSMAFLKSNFEILEVSKNYLFIAHTYEELGLLHLDMGEFTKADSYLHQSLEIQLEQLGPNHINVADSHNNLGIVCKNNGDLQLAGDYHQRALEIQLEQLGPNHIKVADSYNNLGIVCRNKGDLQIAKDYHQRALEIQLEQLGPNHINVATSYNNLGNVCQNKGDLQLAEDYLHQSLEIHLEQLGPNHINVADSYNYLGIVCRNKGDLQLAGDYHQRALEIQFEQLGPNHIKVADSYNDLGIVCRNKGDLRLAKDYHQRALEIQLEQLGPNHIKVATSYNNLGNVCQSKGDLQLAEDYHQRALEIHLEQLGPNHINVAYSYNNLGLVCKNKGDQQLAEDYHQRALGIKLEQLGPNHIKVATSYNNLGLVCKNKGDLQLAKDYHQRALGILVKQLGPNHINVATSYNNLGNVCKSKGDLQLAEDYHRRALEIRVEQLGPNHFDVAASYHNLSIVFSHKRERERAEYYRRRAQEIRPEYYGSTPINASGSRKSRCILL